MSDFFDDQGEAVVSTLKRMLAYDAEERPDLRELLNLLEDLVANVHDGSLKKFCREVVVPCKDAEDGPEKTEDPLTGTTLFEDASRMFGTDGSAASEDGMDISVAIPKEPADTTMPVVANLSPQGSTDPIPRVSTAEIVEKTPSSGGGLKIVLGLFFLLGLVGAGAVALYISQDEEPPPATSDPMPEIVVQGDPGGTKDLEAKGDSGKVSLQLVPSGGAVVKIKGPDSYKYTWDGKETLVLENAPVGTYKTRFEASETRIDATTFRVKKDADCKLIRNLKDSSEDDWKEKCSD
jgi:hypothetical protein